ncbi:MAG: DEAD/DEAH box helicase family protein, partial [Planctomycetes bacterium]|nr:DEAD/DEAH box helicase family protein [Planctomycetota bacterium]
LTSRGKPRRADYLLFARDNYPIAVIEAKDNRHAVSSGLQQAMEYARMLDVPFAYSSNGDAFMEHDFLSGTEREMALEEFPAAAELIARYLEKGNHGAPFTPAQEKVMAQPYYTSQTTHPPRYYQRVAINRALAAIAGGQKRVLLAMATGTGKTYTAFQIVYRLLQSGTKRKVLYLADRNILVDQSIQQDFAPLEKVAHKINVARDDPGAITAHEVYFSLYQQLIGENGQEHFAELFRPDFFDLIIVDECHRGSAKDDSCWRRILEYFSAATQIGMTATPKETKYVSNIGYFGDPVFVYSLKNGIEDGFLAPFKVINVATNIGDGWRPTKGMLDKFGNPIEDRIYNNSDYDYNIVIEDRVREVARKITDYLQRTDRMAKTIVFCATEEAAERMRVALLNLNSDMVKQNPDYVVRITGSDAYGKSKLDYFISVSTPYPVIATTSKLLSTGADCKMTKLIVLDEMINSMTEFKQIIGRGTRLRVKEGKTHFVIMDFRNVVRLFADPEWDGPIEVAPDYDPSGASDVSAPATVYDPEPPEGPKTKPVVGRDGCRVEVVYETVSVFDADGKLLRQESITDYTRRNVRGAYATLDAFIREWRA